MVHWLGRSRFRSERRPVTDVSSKEGHRVIKNGGIAMRRVAEEHLLDSHVVVGTRHDPILLMSAVQKVRPRLDTDGIIITAIDEHEGNSLCPVMDSVEITLGPACKRDRAICHR